MWGGGDDGEGAGDEGGDLFGGGAVGVPESQFGVAVLVDDGFYLPPAVVWLDGGGQVGGGVQVGRPLLSCETSTVCTSAPTSDNMDATIAVEESTTPSSVPVRSTKRREIPGFSRVRSPFIIGGIERTFPLESSSIGYGPFDTSFR